MYALLRSRKYEKYHKDAYIFHILEISCRYYLIHIIFLLPVLKR